MLEFKLLGLVRSPLVGMIIVCCRSRRRIATGFSSILDEI